MNERVAKMILDASDTMHSSQSYVYFSHFVNTENYIVKPITNYISSKDVSEI